MSAPICSYHFCVIEIVAIIFREGKRISFRGYFRSPCLCNWEEVIDIVLCPFGERAWLKRWSWDILEPLNQESFSMNSIQELSEVVAKCRQGRRRAKFPKNFWISVKKLSTLHSYQEISQAMGVHSSFLTKKLKGIDSQSFVPIELRQSTVLSIEFTSSHGRPITVRCDQTDVSTLKFLLPMVAGLWFIFLPPCVYLPAWKRLISEKGSMAWRRPAVQFSMRILFQEPFFYSRTEQEQQSRPSFTTARDFGCARSGFPKENFIGGPKAHLKALLYYRRMSSRRFFGTEILPVDVFQEHGKKSCHKKHYFLHYVRSKTIFNMVFSDAKIRSTRIYPWANRIIAR